MCVRCLWHRHLISSLGPEALRCACKPSVNCKTSHCLEQGEATCHPATRLRLCRCLHWLAWDPGNAPEMPRGVTAGNVLVAREAGWAWLPVSHGQLRQAVALDLQVLHQRSRTCTCVQCTQLVIAR